MIRLVTGRRRLLRKRMYNAPHERQRNTYFRENKSVKKHFQSDYVNNERVYTKRRPKREAVSGFKMAYRYKYLKEDKDEEEDEEL
ncbi:hypothetical protein [Methanobrevibacter sp.]|uniref:hypothetical protein n=1 Tax=Methanobrevibacter sp. TaxID=66852 RepID=UPI00388D46F6